MRKLDHLIVVAAISQWRCRLSACVRAHGGNFENFWWCFHGVNVDNFWIWGLTVWLVCS